MYLYIHIHSIDHIHHIHIKNRNKHIPYMRYLPARGHTLRHLLPHGAHRRHGHLHHASGDAQRRRRLGAQRALGSRKGVPLVDGEKMVRYDTCGIYIYICGICDVYV